MGGKREVKTYSINNRAVSFDCIIMHVSDPSVLFDSLDLNVCCSIAFTPSGARAEGSESDDNSEITCFLLSCLLFYV